VTTAQKLLVTQIVVVGLSIAEAVHTFTLLKATVHGMLQDFSWESR
jgi:hypothetical protein